MSNNRTFFKNAAEGQMSLRDVFSDVTRSHTPEESARVFIAGTALTTPDESEMLAGWQKPFLFARFALATFICMLISMVLAPFVKGGFDPLLAGMALMVPMTVLLLAWEMNIPRTISLMEIFKIVGIGGMLSLLFTIALIFAGIDLDGAIGAPAVEEPAKLAVVYILLRRKNRKYILEGVLLGMAVGTGFAIVETFGYIMDSSREGMLNYIAYCLDRNITVSFQEVLDVGYASGIDTAITRAFNGIVGHGVYAAIYSGGLMIAKGDEEVRFGHLLTPTFLKYFAASCLIHLLNNSPIVGAFFPYILGGMIWSWSFVKIALGAAFLLPLMRTGVNQVVQVCTAHNSGRVTLAVNRDVADVKIGGGAGVSVGAGAVSAASRIEFLSGPLAGQSFGIHAGQSVTVGRSPSCTIPVVGAGNVSGRHCSITLNGSMMLITDLGSTNGTYVGSQKLVPQQATLVPDGGIVYLGNKSCAFRVSSR